MPRVNIRGNHSARHCLKPLMRSPYEDKKKQGGAAVVLVFLDILYFFSLQHTISSSPARVLRPSWLTRARVLAGCLSLCSVAGQLLIVVLLLLLLLAP